MEDGLLKILIETTPEKELEIRKTISLQLANINRAVLKNDKIKANLEEIFIELTNPDREEESE